MSDVEQADDEVLENPDPEADIAVDADRLSDRLSDSDYESNIDHNDELVACAEGNIAEDVIVRNYDDVERDLTNQNNDVDNSWAESDQSNHALNYNAGAHHNESGLAVVDVDATERNSNDLENNEDTTERNDQDTANGTENLAAEDEQYLRNGEINFEGAEWSLEPEENSHNYGSYNNRDRIDEGYPVDAVESDQIDSSETEDGLSAARTKSCSQFDSESDQNNGSGQNNGSVVNAADNGSGLQDMNDINLINQQNRTEGDGIENSGLPEGSLDLHEEDGTIEEAQLEAEEDRGLEMEKETTEADQEFRTEFRTNNQLVDASQSVGIVEVTSDSSDRNRHVSTGDVPRSGPSNVGQVPDDEVGSLATSESVTMVTSESYQPECDQTEKKESHSTSSPENVNTEMAVPIQNSAITNAEANGAVSSEIESNITEASNSNHAKISENQAFPENVKEKTDSSESDKDTNFTQNNSSQVGGEKICDNDLSTKPKSVLNSQEISLTSDKGAIPKHRPTNHTMSDNHDVRRTNNQTNTDLAKTSQSVNSHPNPKVEEIEDAEDALLSELDATLQSDFSVVDKKVKTNNSSVNNESSEGKKVNVVNMEDIEGTEQSCDQCVQNNERDSKGGDQSNDARGDNPSNIPDIKELKKQLNQAKNLLLERECQISRLKEDLEEKEERYNTVMLERDTYNKELECMKTQNSDDLYIPQIKELEYTIAQQQNEIRSWKDKLASHDGAAKRAIATLQNEMKIRLEQMTKTCDEATKEKDSMVVKYAQAEHKNLEYQKQAERAEAKVREMEKERDAFLLKMKAVKEQRTKLGAEVENRNAEINSINKELDKHRELVSSGDVRVKWAQNKLKAELEAHKETKVQLEKMTGKLKEAKEETTQIRADCQAIIKTYQESEEVKSNSLDKELKQKETELLVNLQEKTNWELAHVKTQRELEGVKGELRDSKAQCANLTEKLSSLEGNLNQSSSTVDKYGEIIQKQKKEIQELRERIETLVQYRTDFTRSQELIKTLDSEIAELKISNKDLLAENEACKKREMDKLELTEKLTQKNVELQSENSSLGNKVFSLTGELQTLKMEYQGTDEKIKELTESLNTEQKLRKEETQTLNTKLAGKCKAVEDLTRKVDEEKDEIKTLKRKHTNNVRDLTRQLQLVRRKLETYEASTNGDKDTVSMGSRTSSNGSLNIAEQPNTQVVQPNHTANQLTNSVQNHVPVEPEYPVITEQVEVDKQVLIERIVKLQRALARKNEKLEFMDDHIGQLVDEIQKKNKKKEKSEFMDDRIGQLVDEIQKKNNRSSGAYEVTKENEPPSKVKKLAKKRQSGINTEWKNEFPWLEDLNDGMVCSVCRKHQRRPKKAIPGKTVWVDLPCHSITLQAVKRHKVADAHKEAEAFDRELALSSCQIEQGFDKEFTINRLAMEKAMRCLYWLCKEELPHTTKYQSLLDLCKMMGVNELNALKQSGNASYTSERFIQETLHTFHSLIMTRQMTKARKSPFYTLLIDETTDVSVKKELIIYIRYLNDQMESETHFSQILALKDGKAQTITDAIKDYLSKHSLNINQLCGLGSDGAAVMLGVRGGVAALLKTDVPHLLSNHCVAHRLALASSQAANSIPYLKKFKAIVEQLYRFYQYSPVRTAALQDIQEVLNDPKIKITQAKDVRWLSHDKAINSIRKTFESLLVSLEREAQERSEVQAMGLSVFLQTFNFVATMLMMCDILPVLSQLSKAMQKRDLDYTIVKPLVGATIATMNNLKAQPGVHFSSLDKTYEELCSKDYKFKTADGQKERFMTEVYYPFLDSITENLEKRFPDLPLLESFQIFDPGLLPEDPVEKNSYGIDSLKTLATHFSLPWDETAQEWKTVVEYLECQRTLSASRIMVHLARQLDTFPNLGKIAAAGLLVPTSTADCERGFSTLRRVKTELRSNLSDPILNCLLAVSLEGESVADFNISNCVDMWADVKKRRINLT